MGKINWPEGKEVMKTEKDKVLLLEQFTKTPVIQVACEKTGIGRATYYRWRKEDEAFTTKADQALFEGFRSPRYFLHWLRVLDSNQDTRLQRARSYR